MAYCGKCGSKVIDGNKFCTNCGAEIRIAEQPATVNQTVYQTQGASVPPSNFGYNPSYGTVNPQPAQRQNFAQRVNNNIKEKVDSFPRKLIGLAIAISVFAFSASTYWILLKCLDYENFDSNYKFLYLIVSFFYCAFLFCSFLFIKIGLKDYKSRFSGLLYAALAVTVVYYVFNLSFGILIERLILSEDFEALEITHSINFIIKFLSHIFFGIVSLVMLIKLDGKIKKFVLFLFIGFIFSFLYLLLGFLINLKIPELLNYEYDYEYDFYFTIISNISKVLNWTDFITSLVLHIFVCIYAFKMIRKN